MSILSKQEKTNMGCVKTQLICFHLSLSN